MIYILISFGLPLEVFCVGLVGIVEADFAEGQVLSTRASRAPAEPQARATRLSGWFLEVRHQSTSVNYFYITRLEKGQIESF